MFKGDSNKENHRIIGVNIKVEGVHLNPLVATWLRQCLKVSI